MGGPAPWSHAGLPCNPLPQSCPTQIPDRGPVIRRLAWRFAWRANRRERRRFAASAGDSPRNSRYVFCEATTWKPNEICYGKFRYAGHASGGAYTRTSLPAELSSRVPPGAGIRSWIVWPDPGFNPGSGPTIQDLIPPPRQLCHSLWPRRSQTGTRTAKRGSVLCCFQRTGHDVQADPKSEIRKRYEQFERQATNTRNTNKRTCENNKINKKNAAVLEQPSRSAANSHRAGAAGGQRARLPDALRPV